MSRLLNHNFWVRTLSGVVLFILVVGLTKASPYTLLMLLAAICIGGMLEFYKIARLTGAEPLETYPTILGVLAMLIAFFGRLGQISFAWFLIFIPALFILFVVELYRKKKNPFANVAWAIAGLIYIAVPMALLAYIPVQAGTGGVIVYRPFMVMSIIFIVWANDVGAYLCGVTMGRHKLFERISPKKSWEGFVGGIICAVGVGMLMSHIQSSPLMLWGWAGLVIAVAGVFGDLVESMFKRSVGLKDSGNLIPGHGGILDRFDALIFAVPFVFMYFVLFL